jgi:integrase
MAYKEKDTKTWSAQWFEINAKGEKRKRKKRGFETKREALEYERQKKLSTTRDMDMKLSEFMEVYFEDKQNELKERTIKNKKYMMEQHIIPYFGNKKMSEITASQIIQWQNEIQMKGFSESYLRMIQNQLTSLFTHASRIYDLHTNPCKKVKKMGNFDSKSLNFWTTEEYQKFLATMEEGAKYHLIFEILFWTGCRIGELLALTPSDIDFDKNQISITKTYYRTGRQDIVTEPKTKQSVRRIEIPEFLKQEIKDFIDRHYGMPENERLFPVVQEAVQHKMKRQIEIAGVKKIRVHDLRHSHVAYLIHKGIEPILIKDRLGHKDIRITLNTYGHLYPNQQRKVADLLDMEKQKSPNSVTYQDSVINEDESSNINLRQVDYNKDSSNYQSLNSK